MRPGQRCKTPKEPKGTRIPSNMCQKPQSFWKIFSGLTNKSGTFWKNWVPTTCRQSDMVLWWSGAVFTASGPGRFCVIDENSWIWFLEETDRLTLSTTLQNDRKDNNHRALRRISSQRIAIRKPCTMTSSHGEEDKERKPLPWLC